MRVAIDAYHALRPYGGIARYIRSLVGEMAIQAPDDRFVLFANRFRETGEMWRPQAANVEAVALSAPRRLMQMAWNYLDMPPVEWWTGDVDIFHGTHFILPAVRRARCVLTVHDLTYLRHPEYFSDRSLNERGYGVELPRALQRADAVVAISGSTKADLIELLHVPEERIHVIHSGVEPAFFVPDDEEMLAGIRRRYGLDGPYMTFLVGAPEPRKNLQRTMAAARRAAPEVPLLLVGPEVPIRTLLGDASEGVRVLDGVSDADLPWLLQGAELALYPSLYEGFGLPVLEAMAAGTAVITSNISACSEVAGDAAMTVDPHSEEEIETAIRMLMTDEEMRANYARMGRERAATFSWQSAAAEMLRLYRSLAG